VAPVSASQLKSELSCRGVEGEGEDEDEGALALPANSTTLCAFSVLGVELLNVDSRVRGGESNGSCYESNGLELTVVYCEQV
jgi:hypothetical protein